MDEFDTKLYEALKELDIIPNKKLAESVKEAKAKNTKLKTVLLQKDLISDKNLGKVIADLHATSFVDLSDIHINDETISIIPEEFARQHKIVAFKKTDSHLHVAISTFDNAEVIDFLHKKTGLSVVIHHATLNDIKDALAHYNSNIEEDFENLIGSYIDKAKQTTGERVEAPIVKIVDTLIDHAYQSKASDIHLEPYEEYALVRFRLDGLLHDILQLPFEIYPQIVTRIKVLSKLQTDEHQAAQDGKMQFKTDDEDLDLRVSIVPVTDGEKVVMRLLSERARSFSLQDLGLSDKNLDKVKAAYKQPHGMIIATGPTGSGKTTTMYAILKLLNTREVNIMTIEDPIEYDVEGINQIQVKRKTDLTFAKGLRSIVRQDPDIILVGEIRDEETAGIAINSALTGHLLLSTLHTNNAATAVPRLIDMHIEPFLVGSTLNVIIAQRLVRKICESCRMSKDATAAQLKKDEARQYPEELIKRLFKSKKSLRVYRGKGCKICHSTGYRGRIGLFEVLVMDDDIREAIIERKDADTIQDIAVKKGMTTMLDDGIEKIKQGVTTIDEVIRVTAD